MIATDRFVVLNNPKTGSTFFRAALKRIHGYETEPGRLRRLAARAGLAKVGMSELILPNIRSADPRPPDQHGTYSQIPAEHRRKPVVSVVRDPFARLLSTYRFRWWAEWPGVSADQLKRHLPAFPDLTLEEYFRLERLDAQARLPGSDGRLRVGFQTIQFIQMFFRDPPSVLAGIDEAYLDSERFVEDMAPIHFLQTENLNRGIFDFLIQSGYPPERIEFILRAPPVNTTGGSADDHAWTRDLVAEILDSERLLFRILQRLGFRYAPPPIPAGDG